MATAIVQARMGSTRLPGKVLRQLGGRSVLEWVLRAAAESGALDQIVVATTEDEADDVIEAKCIQLGVPCTRGSRDDVLDRFLDAVTQHPTDVIVRLTADCPLLDPAVIRMAVRAFDASTVDYLSTISPRSLPRGLDVEVVSVNALRVAAGEATGADRAHVTSFIYGNADRFRLAGLTFSPAADDLRVTLDEPDDARLLAAVVEALGDAPPAWRDVVAFLRAHPDVVAMNAAVRQKALSEG